MTILYDQLLAVRASGQPLKGYGRVFSKINLLFHS
jgi:hypothetical protein